MGAKNESRTEVKKKIESEISTTITNITENITKVVNQTTNDTTTKMVQETKASVKIQNQLAEVILICAIDRSNLKPVLICLVFL